MKNSHFELLSNYLSEKRLAKGFTQGELAKALGYTSPQFISNWERGLAEPPLEALKKMVKILDLDRDELISILMKLQELYLREVLYGVTKTSVNKKVRAKK